MLSIITTPIRPHPNYRRALRTTLWVLLCLAVFQMLAWFLINAYPQQAITGYATLHTLLETIAIVTSACVFAVGWSTYDQQRADRFTLLACVFLGVALLDFLHVVSFRDMPAFITASNIEKTINFWLEARLLAALGLLSISVGGCRQTHSPVLRWLLLAIVLLLVALLAWLGLLHNQWLPRTFIPGTGLTPFKIHCEYVLIALYGIAAMGFLYKMRATQTYDVVGLFAAASITAMSEGFFTLYADVADIYNLLGHIYKVVAYGFIYKSIFIDAVREPYRRLYEAKNLLQVIIDSVPIRVFWKDPALRYLGCNTLFAHDAGLASAQDLIGKDDTQLSWQDQASLYQSDDRRVMSTNEPKLGFEEPQTTPDGKQIWLRTSKVPIYDLHQQTVGILGIYDDITQHRQEMLELENYRAHLEDLVAERTEALRELEERSRLLLEANANGLYGIGEDGTFIFINPAGAQLLGYTAEALIGKPVHAAVHHTLANGSPCLPETCPLLSALRSGRAVRNDDDLFWRADGSPLPVATATQAMFKDSRIIGAVVSFIDIRQQKMLAAAREKALAEAEHLARAKAEFLANMSHEIRTPLNGVLGFAEIGYRDSTGHDKARDTFAKIITSGKLLQGIINDILDLSKLEAGKLHLENIPVKLIDITKEIVDVFKEPIQTKGLMLKVKKANDLPLTCLGDPLRIKQILMNLLANAIKFTEQGNITLSLAKEGGFLLFQVSDTGIGMEQEQLTRLFNAFEQADSSTTRKYGGTGLGLVITRRIVEMMGGEIHVSSTMGIGSEFTIRLPYQAVDPLQLAEEAIPQKPPSKQRLAGLSILVAEDNEVNQAVLSDMLSTEGANIVMVDNGKTAVERVLTDGAGHYDLILMDVQMPQMDGYQATRLILEFAPDMPIVGQTANAFAEDKTDCLAAGMVDHLAKPISIDALVATILKHVRRP
ncbi:MAG: MASE3 domain-containing protein [Methylovulum sp.]|nr:MASE3 domain-containing protein [Methylovulum sp.]